MSRPLKKLFGLSKTSTESINVSLQKLFSEAISLTAYFPGCLKDQVALLPIKESDLLKNQVLVIPPLGEVFSNSNMFPCKHKAVSEKLILFESRGPEVTL